MILNIIKTGQSEPVIGPDCRQEIQSSKRPGLMI
jgi:hypothetical protein